MNMSDSPVPRSQGPYRASDLAIGLRGPPTSAHQTGTPESLAHRDKARDQRIDGFGRWDLPGIFTARNEIANSLDLRAQKARPILCISIIAAMPFGNSDDNRNVLSMWARVVGWAFLRATPLSHECRSLSASQSSSGESPLVVKQCGSGLRGRCCSQEPDEICIGVFDPPWSAALQGSGRCLQNRGAIRWPVCCPSDF